LAKEKDAELKALDIKNNPNIVRRIYNAQDIGKARQAALDTLGSNVQRRKDQKEMMEEATLLQLRTAQKRAQAYLDAEQKRYDRFVASDHYIPDSEAAFAAQEKLDVAKTNLEELTHQLEAREESHRSSLGGRIKGVRKRKRPTRYATLRVGYPRSRRKKARSSNRYSNGLSRSLVRTRKGRRRFSEFSAVD